MDVNDVLNDIYKLGACDFARDYLNEGVSVKKLLELMLTEQGIEFCTKLDYPTSYVFSEFSGFDWKKNGVYFDCGNVLIIDRDIVIVVGKTQADIRCVSNKLFKIILLQGATAKITAKNYAVVVVNKSSTCSIEVIKQDRGVVIYD